MAIWPKNKERYEKRLFTLQYLCSNYWRLLQEKEVYDDYTEMTEVIPVIDFYDRSWLPVPLDRDDLTCVGNAASCAFSNRKTSRVDTIDDLITDLGWAFHPDDIKLLKIQYSEPKVKKRKK